MNHFLVSCCSLFLHPCPCQPQSIGMSCNRLCSLFQCSCPNALVTSNAAPTHPHATGVTVYPALFFSSRHPTNRKTSTYFAWNLWGKRFLKSNLFAVAALVVLFCCCFTAIVVVVAAVVAVFEVVHFNMMCSNVHMCV